MQSIFLAQRARFTQVLNLLVTGVILFVAVPASAVPAQGHQIMLAGPSPSAVDVAREIHLNGGNTVDVAVAVALSLAVTHPYFAAFGGGGFAMIKMGSSVEAIDFRETAPAKANADTFSDKPTDASTRGGLAVAIPGVPAGLWEIHKKYGKLKWSKLFGPAISLAERGFRVSGEWSSFTRKDRDRFNEAARRIFFAPKSIALKPGELLRQPGLTSFLKRYRDLGPKAFYDGPVAKELIETVNGNGGIFTSEDLKNYRVRWLEPIRVGYMGHLLHLMPPPSSGGVVIAQAIRLMEKTQLSSKTPLSVDELHLLAEIEKISFRGRTMIGDPSFTSNPYEQLLSEGYLNDLAAKIKPESPLSLEPLDLPPREGENTTHFSVMDSKGNAVSLTVTLNGNYGSGLVTPKFGIALNNEMDDFTTQPGKPNMFGLMQGRANVVKPGARPLSSMSPTIVEKDGRTVLALGAPGGPAIITAVLQVIHRSLTQSLDIDQAIQAPRVHHQFLPNIVRVDTIKFAPETLSGLSSKGHRIESGSTGKVYGVRRDEDGILSGAFDARGEGAAGGL